MLRDAPSIFGVDVPTEASPPSEWIVGHPEVARGMATVIRDVATVSRPSGISGRVAT